MSVEVIDRSTEATPPALATQGMTSRSEQLITAVLVAIPFLALVFGIVWYWGEGLHVRDVLIAVGLFFVAGHGTTIGYHRLLAHRAFVARRPLKLALLGAGSLAFQGGPIGWVADHRRHHVFSDQPQDPHSPHAFGSGPAGRLRGFWHAHVGWLLKHARTSWEHHAPDLLADRDVVVMNALFPLWCAVSLAIPFGLGWLLGGGVSAALTALLWAGAVRVLLLHHVTWSINSVCHTFGRRPFRTNDRSTNFGPLAVVSMGESWHNGHHAFPRSARHGLLPRQWDTSAWLIARFEDAGWAKDVHRPSQEAIRRRLAGSGPPRTTSPT
jgi:stearoyl-CoA desaturase (delta-9 desaturase)